MQPRGNPGLPDRHNRKTRGTGEARNPLTRLDGMIDDPMSCTGTEESARDSGLWRFQVLASSSGLLIRQENSDIVFPPISAKDAEMDGAP